MRLVGLIGFAGVGKNFLAKSLGWPTVAFADQLKADVAYMLNIDQKALEERKEEFRPLLVEYGKAQRLLNPKHWITELSVEIGHFGHDHAVVTDVRYLNEAQWIHDSGGILIHVRRPGVYAANSEEDRSIREIENSGLPTLTVFNVQEQGARELAWIVESKFSEKAA